MIGVVETLLNDNATMVLGSAVTTFNEVCPNEWNMIHRNFRKFCGLLADLDEWGQISALHMLTRYGRTQFVDPEAAHAHKKKKNKGEKPSATEGESDESSGEEEADVFASANMETIVDPDHRLLLRSVLPLLQSRNTGVVLAVATLHHYLAPRMEQVKIAKALIRILHTRKEAKYVILNGILTIVETNPDMFRPHLSDFFVESTEPVYIRKVKIDIVTLLANEGNISRILREFKIYVSQEDKDFVKATIQAIGRCAMLLPEVTETCMQSLTSLIGTHSEAAVAEAIVVVKKLLQVSQGGDESPSSSLASSSSTGKSHRHRHHHHHHGKSNGNSDKSTTGASGEKSNKAKFADIIKHMAKLLDTVKSPQARASIAWIISEHVEELKTVAPDVLRKLAKSFPEEDLLVKLQALNLGVKLYLTNPDQTTQLFQYVLNLAKYDTSYDLRDRARLIRCIVFNAGEKANVLHEHAKDLFLTKKPVPTMDIITPTDSEGEHFFPGSISSLLGHTAYGYLRVPAWNTEVLSSEHRNPIKREWESFAYSGGAAAGVAHTPAPITAISWDQVQHMQPANATSFSSASGGPAAMPRAPAAAPAGYSTREEYEKAFWGEDESSSSSSSSSSSGSRSRSGSTSSTSSGSGSGSESEDEEDAIAAAADDGLFDTPAVFHHPMVPAQQAQQTQQQPQQQPPPHAHDQTEEAASTASSSSSAVAAPLVPETTDSSSSHAAAAATEVAASSEHAAVGAAEDFVPPSDSSADWLGDDEPKKSTSEEHASLI